MRILLAEDEKKISSFIRKALEEASYAVTETHDGEAALAAALREKYDVIVLDLMLPGRSGLQVLTTLRAQKIPTPVLILTARGEVSERVAGLELGADDYLAKPFAMQELLARIGALCRRSAPEKSTELRLGDLVMDPATHQVFRGDYELHLSLREYGLLEFFLRRPNEVHSRTTLCEHVWSHHLEAGTNVVEVYIQRLRRKIDAPFPVKMLQTVRGVGYSLRTPR
jgi:DNA-binding response OmpR family regulator